MLKKIVIGIIYVVIMGALGYAIINILKSGAPKVILVTPTPTPTPYLFATLTPAQTGNDVETTSVNSDAANSFDKKTEQVKLPTATPAATATPVPTATSTPMPVATSTLVPTATSTPTPTATNTPTPVPTATNTPTPVPTATNTPTPKPTKTPTPKPTATSTPTPTPTSKPEYSVVSDSRIILDDSLSAPVVGQTVIKENTNDFAPFADVYNVGASTGLKKSGLGRVIDGIKLTADESLKANVISFSSSTGLGQLAGTAVIDGYDFSDYDFVVIYENLAKDGSRILFRNCKFGSFKKGTSSIGTTVPFEFERCTFDTFVGANASFSECYFTNINMDELSSAKNVTVSRCIFADNSQAAVYGDSEKSALRIGTIYTDDKSTHICVSDYTGKNSKLSIFTETGRMDFTIKTDGTAVCDTKAGVDVKINKISGNVAYGNCFEIVIPRKLSLMLCYDTTTSGKAVQIRFVNETGKEVVLSKALSQKLLGK